MLHRATPGPGCRSKVTSEGVASSSADTPTQLADKLSSFSHILHSVVAANTRPSFGRLRLNGLLKGMQPGSLLTSESRQRLTRKLRVTHELLETHHSPPRAKMRQLAIETTYLT